MLLKMQRILHSRVPDRSRLNAQPDPHVSATGDLEDDCLTAIFGAATLNSAHELQDAYRRADKALYDAKNAGRDRVKLASSNL
jgi:GGDEF domain-containing protein